MDLYSVIFIYTYYYVRPMILLASLIISIIIICTKDRMTKLLGIWMTINAINGMLGALYNLMARYSGVQFTARLSVFNAIVTIVLGTVGSVIFVIYATKKYGLKLYLGIILIVGNSAISVLLRVILNKLLQIKDFTDAVQFSSFISVITALPSLAVAIIWFIIFFKNRHKEKELTLLWIITLNSLINLSSIFVLNIYSYVYAAHDAVSAQENQMTVLLCEAVIGMVISLLINIYVLVKGRKASEDKKLVIVD